MINVKYADDYKLADSGLREKFETGAVRDTCTGKGRFDLITPIGLRRLAVVYEKGAVKYSPRNWERGIPVSRCLDSAERHINCYKAGSADEDHLAQAAWNLFAAMHFEELRPGLNDIPTRALNHSEPRKKLAYIAGPYRGPNLNAVHENISRARAYAIKYWRLGYAVICPHTNVMFMDGAINDSQSDAGDGCPDSQAFLDGDLEMIRRCDVIVMMPGWEKSEGAKQEHEFAKSVGIQIIYEEGFSGQATPVVVAGTK